MKTVVCLLIVAVNAVFGTTITDHAGYPADSGTGHDVGATGGSDVSGEVFRSLSFDGGDGGVSSMPTHGSGVADDKLMSYVLSQIDKGDGLPHDLIRAIVGKNPFDGIPEDYGVMMPGTGTGGDDDNDNIDDSDGDIYGGIQHTAPSGGGLGNEHQTDSSEATQTDASISSGGKATIDITNFVLGQLNVAKQIFENAKAQIQEAEMAGQSGSSGSSAIGMGTRVAASSIVNTAKASARKAIVDARKAYLMTLDDAKRDITLMKALQLKFHGLASAFGSARKAAGTAIIALKRLGSDDDDNNGDDNNSFDKDSSYGSYRRGYSSRSSRRSNSNIKKQHFLSAVASAKSRLAKMKAVEKSFLAVTRALARVRAVAFNNVRKVRKGAIGIAQVMTKCDLAVQSSIEAAKSLIGQAISTSRATAIAKAEVSSRLAQKAEAQARLAIQLAANSLSAAKNFALDTDDNDDADDVDDDDNNGGISDGTSSYGPDNTASIGTGGSSSSYSSNTQFGTDNTASIGTGGSSASYSSNTQFGTDNTASLGTDASSSHTATSYSSSSTDTQTY